MQALEDAVNDKYHLKDLIHKAASTVGFMGGAFIFIDTGVEGADLELPLRISSLSAEMSQNMDLSFVLVDPVNVTPGDYNSGNPLKADYMTPKWWWVLGQKVHASRLIPVFDNPPPVLLRPSYNFLGIPQAQILWDYVLHWNECRIYTANLLKKVSLLVFKTDVNATLQTPGGVQVLDTHMSMFQRYRDNDSVAVCDMTDEDIVNVQTSIAGCTDIVRQSLEMIASINRTPAVKLLGISPSGFNATGDSDIRNYNDHVRTKQELYRSAIMTCIRAIEIAETGKIDPSITSISTHWGLTATPPRLPTRRRASTRSARSLTVRSSAPRRRAWRQRLTPTPASASSMTRCRTPERRRIFRLMSLRTLPPV